MYLLVKTYLHNYTQLINEKGLKKLKKVNLRNNIKIQQYDPYNILLSSIELSAE